MASAAAATNPWSSNPATTAGHLPPPPPPPPLPPPPPPPTHLSQTPDFSSLRPTPPHHYTHSQTDFSSLRPTPTHHHQTGDFASLRPAPHYHPHHHHHMTAAAAAWHHHHHSMTPSIGHSTANGSSPPYLPPIHADGAPLHGENFEYLIADSFTARLTSANGPGFVQDPSPPSICRYASPIHQYSMNGMTLGAMGTMPSQNGLANGSLCGSSMAGDLRSPGSVSSGPSAQTPVGLSGNNGHDQNSSIPTSQSGGGGLTISTSGMNGSTGSNGEGENSLTGLNGSGPGGSESSMIGPNSVSPPIHIGGTHMGGNGGNMRPQPARSPYEWMKKPSYQSQSSTNSGKTRTKDKYRVVYSDHQRLELEKEFHYSRYITIRRKSELASMLGLSERQVKIWFQNRRAKERKQAKKREDIKTKSEKLQAAAAAAAAAQNANAGLGSVQGLGQTGQITVTSGGHQMNQGSAAAAAAAAAVAALNHHHPHHHPLHHPTSIGSSMGGMNGGSPMMSSNGNPMAGHGLLAPSHHYHQSDIVYGLN